MNILLDSRLRPVVAHRGGALHAPENTLEAMDLAVSRGAEALEFDIRLSADGEALVFHDPVVDRTTDGHGPIALKSLGELRELDASARAMPPATWAPLTRRCRIPLFEEVLLRYEQIPLLIEIKAPLASARVLSLIQKHSAGNRCLVAAYDAAALQIFRRAGIPVGASRSDVIGLLAWIFLRAGRMPDFDGLFIPEEYYGFPLPAAKLVGATVASGRAAHIWTVNDTDDARRLWRIGVSGIVTDDVPLMLAARNEFPGGQDR